MLKTLNTIKPSTYLLLLTVLLLSACTKSDSAITTKPDGDYVTCKIDGKEFTSEIAAASYSTFNELGGTFTSFAITGMTIDGEQFVNISILNPVEGKTYTLHEFNIEDEWNLTSITVATALDENYTAQWGIGSGTIKLEHFNKKSASGTFSAVVEHEDVANKTISITDGKFSVTSIIQIEM